MNQTLKSIILIVLILIIIYKLKNLYKSSNLNTSPYPTTTSAPLITCPTSAPLTCPSLPSPPPCPPPPPPCPTCAPCPTPPPCPVFLPCHPRKASNKRQLVIVGNIVCDNDYTCSANSDINNVIDDNPDSVFIQTKNEVNLDKTGKFWEYQCLKMTFNFREPIMTISGIIFTNLSLKSRSIASIFIYKDKQRAEAEPTNFLYKFDIPPPEQQLTTVLNVSFVGLSSITMWFKKAVNGGEGMGFNEIEFFN